MVDNDNTQAWADATKLVCKAAMEGLLESVPQHERTPDVIKSALHAAGEVAGVVMAGSIIKQKAGNRAAHY